jgi:hypothetical protein
LYAKGYDEGEEEMKIYDVANGGTLQVVYKDCYQTPMSQTMQQVQAGMYVVVLSGTEFQRFKKSLL